MSESSQKNDLRNRILFTIFILAIYRLGTFVPLPGIDPEQLQVMMDSNQKGLLGMFNVFAGGAVSRMAIFALGIMPYISSSIIIQLLTGVTEYFKNLKAQGEIGRQKITQITRYGTVLLATVQGYGLAVGLESSADLVINPGAFFKISTVTTIVAGTIFLMWLGEQITENGFGSGISIIIFSGIVANLPFAIFNTFELGRTGALSAIGIVSIIFLLLILIVIIVFIERAQRRLLVQYPKRQVGNKVFGGQSSYFPIKLNISGVIPAIFASSLLLFPNTISNFSPESSGFLSSLGFYLSHGKPLYMAFFFGLIVFFAFFYTSIVFNPKEQAENLRNNGGFVLGYRPGEQTAAYLEHVIFRLTFVGAIYLGLIALIPEFLIARLSVPFYLGGTSLLIVVIVAMDFFSQIQTQLFSSQYEKLLSKNKVYKSKWL